MSTQRIAKIQQLPAQLEAAIAGLNDAQLDTPYRDGGWTVRQVVHHLADSHMNAYIRMRLIATEDRPTLKPYDQDVWARFYDAQSMPVAPSLAILRGLHERWTDFLQRLSAESWSRAGHHPERGEVTLDSLVTIYAGHGAKHVDQIMGLRQAKGW